MALTNLSAKSRNKKVMTFSSHYEFIMSSKDFARAVPIYIDSNLGSDCKGEIIAQEIFSIGFSNIYLATGYDLFDLNVPPYIKAVTGKIPPWESVS